MTDPNLVDHTTANRVLLAASVVFIVSLSSLLFLEFLNIGLLVVIKLYIGMIVVSVILVDHLYTKYFSGKKGNEKNT